MSTKSDESDDDSDEEEFLTDRRMAKEWLTEEEDSIPTGPPRTKNELLFDDSLIYDPDSVVIQSIDHDGEEANSSPIISVNTGPTAFAAEELTLIGTVMCRMDEENTLVVQAAYTQSPLNEGSLLCFQEGIVLGKICEIFGPITTPFYVVKWATLPASTSSNSNVSFKNKEESISNKKKKNKRGSGHSKAVKKEELASIDDNSLEQVEENGDTLQEKVISMDEKDSADSADLSASNGTLPVDAEDAMVVTEIAAAEPVIGEESEEIVAVEETVQTATTTSTAQAEYFAILMSRALPGTAVYSAAKHTVVITASSLSALRKQNKGTDASNIYDEEIADDEKEYSDDEEELLAKQERNRAKRTLDPSGKPKLVAQTGGRSAYVSGADSTGTGTGRTTARPSHSAPSSNTHYQQPQQQLQQQQRNQAQPFAARNNNQTAPSNTSQPQRSQHQGLMYSNQQPPQQYQNRAEPPLHTQQHQQMQQQQYQGNYGQPQHGNYMPGVAHPMQGFDQTLHGNYPSMGMGYGHPPQPAGPSNPLRGGPIGSPQGEYLPNYAAPQPMGGVHMQQQYGIPQQYQQQQQPAYHFPTHIQGVPQGQSAGAPWPGFGVSPNGSGNGAGLGAGTAGSTGKLPAYVHQPIQFNTKMP